MWMLALAYLAAIVLFVVFCASYARAHKPVVEAGPDLALVVDGHLPCKRGACDCSRYPGVHVGRSPF